MKMHLIVVAAICGLAAFASGSRGEEASANTLVPIYIDHETRKPIKTEANFLAARVPANAKLADIKDEMCGGLIPAKILTEFFVAIERQDAKAVAKFAGGEERAKRIMKRFLLPNIDFKSLVVLDLFPRENSVKVFYSIDDPRSASRKYVSYFEFEKNPPHRLAGGVGEPMQNLFDLSLIYFYMSDEYKNGGFKQADDGLNAPCLVKILTGGDIAKVEGLVDFYNRFTAARESGDAGRLVPFYTEISAKKN